MNELEKALEQLNIKYETNGKQYKIPTTKENLVELLKGYIAMTINLQSKIDKAIEYIENHFIFDDENGEYYQTHTFDKDNAKELHDILKEDK